MNTLDLLEKLGAPGWLVWLVGKIVPNAKLPLVSKSENPEIEGIIPVSDIGVELGEWVDKECHDMMDGGRFTKKVFNPLHPAACSTRQHLDEVVVIGAR
jgi:hypothetical protein